MAITVLRSENSIENVNYKTNRKIQNAENKTRDAAYNYAFADGTASAALDLHQPFPSDDKWQRKTYRT